MDRGRRAAPIGVVALVRRVLRGMVRVVGLVRGRSRQSSLKARVDGGSRVQGMNQNSPDPTDIVFPDPNPPSPDPERPETVAALVPPLTGEPAGESAEAPVHTTVTGTPTEIFEEKATF